MSKKGLAVIYDPHNLYQFLWYYCTYGKDIEWYALCLPNSYKGEYLSKECKKLNIFKEIYTDSVPFDSLPFRKKISLFFQMLIYALIGRQKKFASNFISPYIKDLSFDTAVILTDIGFISGMFCLFGKEKEIVILEDGMGDYEDRKYINIFKHLKNFYDIQGFFLSLLRYSSPSHYFPLYTSKNCIKFCSHPEKMKYKKYKEMRVLFDMNNTDLELFKHFIYMLYPNIKDYFSENKQVILFTTPLSDYVTNTKPYVNLIEEYINKNYSDIIVKKHPRDNANYNFSNGVIEIPQQIPAEVLLPFLGKMKILFMETSALNLYISSFGYIPYFFYFNTLFEDNKIEKDILSKYYTKDELADKLNYYNFDGNIITI